MNKERLVILRLEDPNKPSIYGEYAIITSLTNTQLFEQIKRIRDEFEEQDFPWCYDDIIQELYNRNLVKSPEIQINWFTICI